MSTCSAAGYDLVSESTMAWRMRRHGRLEPSRHRSDTGCPQLSRVSLLAQDDAEVGDDGDGVGKRRQEREAG